MRSIPFTLLWSGAAALLSSTSKTHNLPRGGLSTTWAKKQLKISDWAEDAKESGGVYRDGEFLTKEGLEAERAAEAKAAMAKAQETKPPELFLKAGPDGVSPGDCPFAHLDRMMLAYKGVEVVLRPCANNEAKPKWLLDGYEGKMPALLHDSDCIVESADIAKYVDFFWPSPACAAPLEGAGAEACSSFFPAVAKFIKNTDPSADAELEAGLVKALEAIDTHLAANKGDGPFLAGSQLLGLEDCSLAPKLHHMHVAAKHYKSFEPPAELRALAAYTEAVFAHPAFAETKATDEAVIWGWGNARSLK
mmetsp:Transcript_45326/g.102378  ORF Transcript_45326/g.102378 Transcript_45326/m.102378 type:complete len:306 (+) Transcript_45326:19-936(+)|eukprot:CAMPEP_0172617218 /NCGR_PEP_ID=MMETSP1068-20121228/70113_1 /TAXON_ID=35684 /ORGANISM="Pseudopedinella elastica, Strain CCMP716" /LENGTH=305 /DNA_ID=CAMNT_0013422929 /DNA_START=19 /DNA_END=936 /DNA_ORIENTATION=-